MDLPNNFSSNKELLQAPPCWTLPSNFGRLSQEEKEKKLDKCYKKKKNQTTLVRFICRVHVKPQLLTNVCK